MAKKNDVVLDEIDAFIEQEKAPRKKQSKKKEQIAKEEVKEEVTDEKIEEVVEPKKRGRKKKEVTLEKKEEVHEVKEEPKEAKKEEKVKEKNNVTDEEDLYLTQSFKPLRTKRRLKKSVIKFFRNLIIFGILGGLVFFGYTKVKDLYNMLKPVNVYKEVINGLEEASYEILNVIPEDNNFSVEVSVDTNIKDYTYFNNNKMSYTYNSIEDGYEDLIKVNDNGIYTLRNNDGTYVQYANSSKIFEVEGRYSLWAELATSIFETRDNLKDIIDGNSEILIDILEEDDIKSDRESLSINDLELDVKCHTIKLNEDLINRYLVKLFKDEKLVKKMADFADLSVDEFKKDYEDSLLKLKNKVKFNIYVHKFTFVGFDVEIDGFREAYMYEYEDEFDYKINGLYSILGVEGLEADFRMSSKNIDDETATVLKETDKEVVGAYNNTKITVRESEWIYEYKKGDSYANVVVKFKDGEELNVSLDNLITTTKSIDREHANFEKQLSKEELVIYLVESVFIYG